MEGRLCNYFDLYNVSTVVLGHEVVGDFKCLTFTVAGPRLVRIEPPNDYQVFRGNLVSEDVCGGLCFYYLNGGCRSYGDAAVG